MRLSELLSRAGVSAEAISGDADVASITIDSRRVKPGALFVCMPGMTRDSQSFLPDAAANGASAALVYDGAGLESASSLGLASIQVSGVEDAVWRICDAFFDHPTRNMKVVGVTGTNGKTTTAWLIRDMLSALGLRSGYLGTLGFQLPGEDRPLANTTPFAVELYNLLAEARDRGVQALAMEVSSHALAQKRVDGVEFDAAVFTNLTQDHLDFHGTMESYEAAKWRLFSDLPRQTRKRFVAAINVDDPTGRRWADSPVFVPWQEDWVKWPSASPQERTNLLAYGEETCFSRESVQVGIDHVSFLLAATGSEYSVRAPLGGGYNVENLHSALAGVCALGISPEEAASVTTQVRPVPGRFEAVPNDAGISILIDYAHTPDAVEKLLDTVRPLISGRVITVFGCGGDRDRTKRPLMARAASERSDITVLTSDNPRTEDPAQILRDVAEGIVQSSVSVSIIDRREAVAYAIHQARPGDVVVIAGKGHENYQIVGREKLPMDDRELAREALR